GAIGANAEKHCMTEGQQTGVAKQQIESEQRDGIAEERDHQADVVGRHDEGQQRKHHRAHECNRKRAPHASALPNRPAGRKIRTPIQRTKVALTTNPGKKTSERARISPTTPAPISAPRKEPRPPITTTAKASTTNSIAISSEAADVGTTSAPAVVPSTAPSVKTAE